MKKGIFVNRRIIWIKPDIYLIHDQFYGEGEHEYRQHFHFAPEGEIFTEANLVTFRGKETSAFLNFLTKETILEKSRGVTSSHYNQWEENDVINAVLKKEGFAGMITVINGGSSSSVEPAEVKMIEAISHTLHKTLTESQAQAVKITVGERSYVVILCNDEVLHTSDAVIADECFATGNVCVFNASDRKKGERLYGGEVLHV